MTAPLFWVDSGLLGGAAVGAELVLGGAEGHHAVTVRRVRVGEPVLLADGSGMLAQALVTGVGGGELTARVEALRDARPRAPRLVLAQALAKEGRDEAAVEAATELGVDEVLPWQAQRCVVQWRGDRGVKSRRKWERVVLAAAKQSRRATVPAVAAPVATRELAERVGAVVAGGGAAYVLHEEAAIALVAALRAGHADAGVGACAGDGTDAPGAGEILLIVGPEGGIAAEEVAALEAAGARAVRLGDTVLRSGTAGPAALAVVLAATRWLP